MSKSVRSEKPKSAVMPTSAAAAAQAKKIQRKKATTPVFAGFVKTFNLTKYFRDDRDLALKMMGVIALGALFRNPMCQSMVTLSYRVPNAENPRENWMTAMYAKGRGDVGIVAFSIIFFTYLRFVVMKDFFTPLGKHLGIRGSKLERFEEQGYIVFYYIISWTIGMILMYNSPHWMDTEHYFVGYPHDKLSGAFKAYYLVQLGFWIQQFYVVNTDMKRRDYAAMVAHHYITCALIGFSYLAHLTRIGNAILCVMDVSDVFLAIPKMLKYQGYTTICDVLFGLFVISWAITRHYLFPIIIRSLHVWPPVHVNMIWDPSQGLFLNRAVQLGFLSLLYALEAVLCFWFLMIFKVIYKMFKGGAADDNRSHDEESDGETVVNEVDSLAVKDKKL